MKTVTPYTYMFVKPNQLDHGNLTRCVDNLFDFVLTFYFKFPSSPILNGLISITQFFCTLSFAAGESNVFVCSFLFNQFSNFIYYPHFLSILLSLQGSRLAQWIAPLFSKPKILDLMSVFLPFIFMIKGAPNSIQR